MNTFKTYILLAGLTGLFGATGYIMGGQNGMVIALVISVAINAVTYWYADKIILAMYDAKIVTDGWLLDIITDLAHRAKLPMPKVYIIESTQPNAFATGRNPSHSAIVVTRGILETLDGQELRGVLGHELAHIKNRDTLIMTVTATLAGALSTLANFSLFIGIDGRDRPTGYIGTLLLIILAPLTATLVQLAISRTREYEADKGGAEICGEPKALASALAKLEQKTKREPNWIAEQNPGTAHIFIINPLHIGNIDNMFRTHPNTQNRIRALYELAYKMDMSNHIGTMWKKHTI